MYWNCKTYFSYRYGTFSAEELVKAGNEAGASVMALTNINNTSDLWDFVKYCTEAKIKPVAGVEIRNEDQCQYVLLARNNEGLAEINRFLSAHLIEKKDFPESAPMSGNVVIIYPFEHYPTELMGNEYIGVQPHEINKLYALENIELLDRMLVQQPVTFADKRNYNLHRLLRAIDKNILLSMQEKSERAGPHESFLPLADLMSSYRKYPQLISNTIKLLDNCSIKMNYKTDKNKKFFTVSKEDDRELLRKLAYDGLEYRYGNNTEARERIEKELRIIDLLNFNAYFLITWDMLQYAKSRKFAHVGRGSGANSIVAYCLQITDVDPIELDLYFERFLNPNRSSPPDFDIDFSWQHRDEMTDYIFKRYSKDHVALLGMFTTFQFSAAVRELGKVFGLPKSEIDQMAAGNFLTNDKIHDLVLLYAGLMKDMPNHQSIHPGGILISEQPIYYYCAIAMPPKGFRCTQIDMFVAEDIGLYKFDVLSQRGLGHISDTIKLVRQTRGIDIDIQQVEKFKKDPALAANIRSGNTIGCFYIESPSMRQLLKKLRCDDYLRLVAASSIIRPGVGQSGMMQEYIYRYHNPDKFEYLHPKMKELLEETYGVMVYQEDVIKVAHHYGGLDLDESDILRRAMSGKFRGEKEMQRLEQKFFENCRERGYPEKTSGEVWRQISSFAGYSFSKAHSASFAIESYQSLYLKTYYPVEFMVSVINNFGGFYRTEIYFQQLARTGAQVELPCVNHSHHLTTIIDKKVYVGFVHLKGLKEELGRLIIQERERGGPYQHFQDFMERTRVSEEQVKILIKVGALRFTGRNKRELLWESGFLERPKSKVALGTEALFKEEPLSFNLPNLEQSSLEDAMQQQEFMEFQLGNIFDMVDDDPSRYVAAKDLKKNLGRRINCLGYLVTIKDTKTKAKGERMHFGTWIDAEGEWLDTVHFPKSAKEFPFQEGGFYRFYGRVIEEFGVYSVSVERMVKVGIRLVTD